MTSLRRRALAISLISLTSVAASHSQTHVFKDWSVACDNVRHCEAVGTQPDDGALASVALWLARDAGPGAPLQAKLLVSDDAGAQAGPLTLAIGRWVLPDLAADAVLSHEQALAIVVQASAARRAEVSDGKTRWILSLDGFNAAVLKMDDVQGRIDTPGALLRRGSRPEASVPAAVPVPTVRAATLPPGPVPGNRVRDAVLADARRSGDSCFEMLPDDQQPEVSIQRVSDDRVLVLRECWRGAYQSGAGVWMAFDKPPHRARRLRLPKGEPGLSDDDVPNGELEGGRLSGYAKGRGLFDCGAGWEWVWTGNQFELASAWTSPLCRGIPGGTPLRTWVTHVVP